MNVNSVRPNFESINYTLRPGKNVERKMLCEAFSRLSILENIRNYRYIGFGSAYFSDFNLFHKNLGISKLISIEKEMSYEKRISFNKPYSCIDLEFGESSEILPRLPWKRWIEKTIVWLDYTQKISDIMLSDIRTVISELKPGSIFIISINIEQDKHNPESKRSAKEGRLKNIEDRLGKSNVPQRAYDMNLNVENNKSIVREIIDSAIRNELMIRNGDKNNSEKIEYKQLFNFYYKDGADMLTVGGIVHNKEQTSKIEDMKFENLEFIKFGETTFDIIVPNLTFREIHALDKLLPTTPEAASELPIAENDIRNYTNIYRYFPTFTEANF